VHVVTALYGARSALCPRGRLDRHPLVLAVEHRLAAAPARLPRPVERQYENCSDAGSKWLHHGSSAPFHIATAGSPSSAPTTFCSSASLAEPAVARLTVLRLTHV
jgi:hypothetical protein